MAEEWVEIEEELKKEEFLSYDQNKYNFRDVLKRIFGVEELEQVHKLDEKSSLPGYVSFENDQATYFHKVFYSSPYFDEFIELYKKFVQECIAPLFVKYGEKQIIYQKRPTFRVCLPNNIAVGKQHTDSAYNHPLGEINYWIPFTQAYDSNALYVESSPDAGDFHPLSKTLNFGDIFRFWGNRCAHYNLPNTTGITRVSVDFRVIPFSKFRESEKESVKANLKFVIGGYYELCDVPNNNNDNNNNNNNNDSNV